MQSYLIFFSNFFTLVEICQWSDTYIDEFYLIVSSDKCLKTAASATTDNETNLHNLCYIPKTRFSLYSNIMFKLLKYDFNLFLFLQENNNLNNTKRIFWHIDYYIGILILIFGILIISSCCVKCVFEEDQ